MSILINLQEKIFNFYKICSQKTRKLPKIPISVPNVFTSQLDMRNKSDNKIVFSTAVKARMKVVTKCYNGYTSVILIRLPLYKCINLSS